MRTFFPACSVRRTSAPGDSAWARLRSCRQTCTTQAMVQASRHGCRRSAIGSPQARFSCSCRDNGSQPAFPWRSASRSPSSLGTARLVRDRPARTCERCTRRADFVVSVCYAHASPDSARPRRRDGSRLCKASGRSASAIAVAAASPMVRACAAAARRRARTAHRVHAAHRVRRCEPACAR